VPALDGFARWRNTIVSACIGFSAYILTPALVAELFAVSRAPPTLG